MTQRPDSSEYADYYANYVRLVPDGDIVEILEAQLDEYVDFVASIPEDKFDHRYREGKWSIKEVLGHINDVERNLVFRALTFARGDAGPLPGFDQEDYVAATDFSKRALADIRDEFLHHRKSSLHFFRPLTDEEMLRRGVANGVKLTVRSIPYIIAGHLTHHLYFVRENYLG